MIAIANELATIDFKIKFALRRVSVLMPTTPMP